MQNRMLYRKLITVSTLVAMMVMIFATGWILGTRSLDGRAQAQGNPPGVQTLGIDIFFVGKHLKENSDFFLHAGVKISMKRIGFSFFTWFIKSIILFLSESS